MASSIDYMGDLNKSLQPKRKFDEITKDTSEAIAKVFLRGVTRDTTKEGRITALSDQIKNGPETMKVRLAIIINYLSKEGLLKPESIRTLTADEIKSIAGADENKKIANIIDYITKTGRKSGEELSADKKEELSKAVIDGLDKFYGDLAKEDDESGAWRSRAEELEAELRASEKADEVVEAALLERWSRNRIMRAGKAIQKTVKDASLKPEDKDRKVLRQANSSAISGRGRRFDWINKLPSKIDANEEYKKAMDNLTKKMRDPKTKPDEKVVIRYIARESTKHYSDYVERTVVSEDKRKENLKTINGLMAA